MEFQIGEILHIGGADPYYHLSPSIEGLDSPAIRVGDGLYAGRDGGFVSGHFYGHRTITFKGFYIGDTCEHAGELREHLFGMLRIRYSLPIRITTPSGKYYTEGFVTDVKSSVDNLKAGEFQITLLCPDPLIYVMDENTKSPIIVEETLINGGTTGLVNQGNVDIFPVITVKGLINNLEIANDTTEKVMQVNAVTTSNEDEVVIDMVKRLITLNGETINKNRSVLSSWWSLIPGSNTVTTNVEEESGGSGVEIKISYKRALAGI